ncbi:MAG: ABC transporter ATP-binding protein [Vulcanimicrobiaceae bacterium]
MSEVVEVRDLVKVHAPGSPTEVRALDAISFTIERGSYVAIVGKSGSGKTTLMHVLGGLDRPTSGSAVVDGVDVARAPRPVLKRLRAERIGFVFQGFNLISSLDALDNVLLPARYAGVTTATARERGQRLLAELGLGERQHHRPQQLSGGQQQRVAIARALVNAPALVLADEPTGELDARTGATILDLFDRIHRERGQTLVVVTHSEAVWSRAQRVIRLADGRIVA